MKLSTERILLSPLTLRIAALGVVLMAGSPLHAAPPAPAARVADLVWLEGHWRDESGGHLSEELWTAPSGDSIMGMWRWVEDGKVRIFELLAIKQEEGGLVLRLRHFDPKLVAREDKERPLAWPLLRSGPREVVFEGPDATAQGKARLTYRRPDEDTLVVILDKAGKAQEFRYRRVKPAAAGNP